MFRKKYVDFRPMRLRTPTARNTAPLSFTVSITPPGAAQLSLSEYEVIGF
jgi:hypothetical protein